MNCGVAEDEALRREGNEGLQMRQSYADCSVQLVGGAVYSILVLKPVFVALTS
jgi:hypothetical protein